MKKLLLLSLFLYALSGISQEPTEVTFDDGTVVSVTLNYDDPDRMYDLSIGASVGSIIINQSVTGLSLTPEYRFSDKLLFSARLFLPLIDRNKSAISESVAEQVGQATKAALEFFPEVHYCLKSSTVSKDKSVQVKYEAGADVSTNYVLKLPLKVKKEIFLDGGLNYTQLTVDNTFQTDELESYTLYGQSIIAFSAGISRIKTNNYKLTMDDRTRVYARSSKIGFRLLLGAPASSNIVKATEALVGDDIDYEFDVESGFEKPGFLNVGARFSFDRIRSFAKKPEMFLTWGTEVGVQPGYGGGANGLVDLGNEMGGLFYFGLRLGVGLGRIPN